MARHRAFRLPASGASLAAMAGWSAFLPTFLAAAVEWVEAFTILLAVALSIGWAAAAGAGAAALALLAALTAITGGLLSLGHDVVLIRLLIGVVLLLFGVRWLAKAVARQAGLRTLHDEDAVFADTRAVLSRADWQAAWIIAFKGVLLEGLEVWLLVAALGASAGAHTAAVGGALAALVVVIALGATLRAPLRRVPENAMKLLVGAMIVAFGTFWTMESLGGAHTWPLGDWSLAGLAGIYLLGALGLAAGLRRRATLAGLAR